MHYVEWPEGWKKEYIRYVNDPYLLRGLVHRIALCNGLGLLHTLKDLEKVVGPVDGYFPDIKMWLIRGVPLRFHARCIELSDISQEAITKANGLDRASFAMRMRAEGWTYQRISDSLGYAGASSVAVVLRARVQEIGTRDERRYRGSLKYTQEAAKLRRQKQK